MAVSVVMHSVHAQTPGKHTFSADNGVAAIALETRRAFGPGEDGQRQFEALVAEELRRCGITVEFPALNQLPTQERLRALEHIQRRKREADRTQAAVPGGVVLTDRLLRAATVVAHHAEFVPCRFVRADGSVLKCQLTGPGEVEGTAAVRTWYDRTPARRPVRLEEIALLPEVAARLEAVAAEQIPA